MNIVSRKSAITIKTLFSVKTGRKKGGSELDWA
jgi:hypothetical protein